MRRAGLVNLLLLCCFGISVLWGSFIAHSTYAGVSDFKGVYYGARCLLYHHDPYSEKEVTHFYLADGQKFLTDPVHIRARKILTSQVYPPTTYLFIAPFAAIPWPSAEVYWIAVTVVAFAIAALLMWNVGGAYAPVLCALMIGFTLANSELLVAFGNPAGICISLCIFAVWCFLYERFIPLGILCLAVSMAIKPQDSGFIWLYFLLAGGVYRKRALYTLYVTGAIAAVAILWATHVSPHWIHEWYANLVGAGVHGGLSDPGLANSSGGPIIDLQSIISVFHDVPSIYNPISYLICGILLVIGAARTLKSNFTREKAWIALAAIAPLTMILTYHRPLDARLLLLSIPACAMLWVEGGLIGWMAAVLSAAGIVVTADIPVEILKLLANYWHVSTATFGGKLLTILLLRPAPLILLAMAIFYLWVYVRRTGSESEKEVSAEETVTV